MGEFSIEFIKSVSSFSGGGYFMRRNSFENKCKEKSLKTDKKQRT